MVQKRLLYRVRILHGDMLVSSTFPHNNEYHYLELYVRKSFAYSCSIYFRVRRTSIMDGFEPSDGFVEYVEYLAHPLSCDCFHGDD